MLVNRIARILEHSKILSLYAGRYYFCQNFNSTHNHTPSKTEAGSEVKTEPSPAKGKGNSVQIPKLSERVYQLRKSQEVYQGKKCDVILEGQAKILEKQYFFNEKDKSFYEQNVVYNPAEIIKRDMSVAVFETYAEILKEEKGESFNGVQIFDAFADIGLNTVRYAKENSSSLVRLVHACNSDELSFEHMMKNFELNNVLGPNLEVSLGDPNVVMFKKVYARLLDPKFDPKNSYKFDIIDLDAEESPITYLDNAIQAIEERGEQIYNSLNLCKLGLLAVTFRDMAVLASLAFSKCFGTYKVSRIDAPYHHEQAMRIMLYTINSIANKYNKLIRPLLSTCHGGYARVFVTVHTSKAGCQQSFAKSGHEKEKSLTPLSLDLHELSHFFKVTVPPLALVNTALKQHNYEMKISYFAPKLIKSNAPLEIFYDFFKSWREMLSYTSSRRPPGKIEEGSPADFFLKKPPK